MQLFLVSTSIFFLNFTGSIFFWSKLRQYARFYIHNFPILVAAFDIIDLQNYNHSSVTFCNVTLNFFYLCHHNRNSFTNLLGTHDSILSWFKYYLSYPGVRDPGFPLAEHCAKKTKWPIDRTEMRLEGTAPLPMGNSRPCSNGALWFVANDTEKSVYNIIFSI